MDSRHSMHRAPWIPWAITSVALALVALVAYTVGAHREAVAVANAGEPVRRAWFFGAPFFFFGPFWFIFVFWFLFGGLRRLWSGGYYPYRPSRYGRYSHPYDDEQEWEQWHRRAHDRMKEPSGGDTGRAGNA